MEKSRIHSGQWLILKRDRQEAYASLHPFVKVTGIKQKNNYKSIWVLSGSDAYTPQDFEREATPMEVCQQFIPQTEAK